jgi:hypothetical protein
MAQGSNYISPEEVKVFLLAEDRLLRETLARLLQKRGVYLSLA